MTKFNFEIEINTEEKTNIFICQYYWVLTNELKYKNSVAEISNKFGIPSSQITKIVGENSSFIIKCKCCSSTISCCKKRSDFYLVDFLKPEFFLCEKCLIEYKKQHNYLNKQKENQTLNPEKILVVDKDVKFKKMKVSFNDKKWNELNDDELETLILIAESTSKSDVLAKVFYNNNEIKSDFRQKIWSRINKIEKLDLIWVERDINSKILHFHILDKLKTALKKQYPELFY